MLLNSRMYKQAVRIALCIPIVAVGITFSGCNSWLVRYYLGDDGPVTSKSADKAPAQLALEGTQKMNQKKYGDALKAFQELKERYPYSKYAILAELKLGDAHYYKGDYNEAAVAYDEFARLHPRNEIIPYVFYQIAMCHFLSFRSIDRDPEDTGLAIESFKRVIQAYPQSQYARRAKEQLVECQKRLAAYEFYVARFYYKRGEYMSAKDRLEKLTNDYPQVIEKLGYDKEIQFMMANCSRHAVNGTKKDSIWTRIGF